MTTPPQPASIPATPSRGDQLWRRLWPMAAAAVGGGVVLEGLGQVLHVPVLAASTATAGLLLLRGWSRTGGRSGGLGSTSSAGWLQRLERLQQQFGQLDPDGAASSRRCVELEQLRAQLERPGLHLGLVGACPEEPSWRAQVAASLRQADRMWFVLAPEGTRRRVDTWKSGFWKIARAADVPVLCIAFDYPSRCLTIGPLLHCTASPRS